MQLVRRYALSRSSVVKADFPRAHSTDHEYVEQGNDLTQSPGLGIDNLPRISIERSSSAHNVEGLPNCCLKADTYSQLSNNLELFLGGFQLVRF